MRTNCTPHTQPGRGVVIIAPPTVRYSEQILYAAILRRASHCVRYPEFGGCPLFGCFYCIICMETAVGACNGVRYSVDVRYWECPLIDNTTVVRCREAVLFSEGPLSEARLYIHCSTQCIPRSDFTPTVISMTSACKYVNYR